MLNHEIEGTNYNPTIKEALQTNELFQKLAIPIVFENFPEIRDAEFFIRHDGSIVNAEGWYHPEGILLGEIMYVPDSNGDRTIFGQKYKKTTLYPGTLNPIPYSERAGVLSQYDDSLNQVSQNPYYARYKQLFSKKDFLAYLPARRTLDSILGDSSPQADKIRSDLIDSEKLLGINLDGMNVGLTGGLLLGNYVNFHDLDIVFGESLEGNIRVAKRIKDLVIQDSSRRVIEGGKGWGIRYYNNLGTLMCNFFTYRNPAEAPLRDFKMDVVDEDVTIEADITDDTHGIYTPTVLSIGNVQSLNRRGKRVDSLVVDSSRLIAYHTATRGECFQGDRVKARGALVNIHTPTDEYKAICVIEREGIRNMTPAWKDYYDNPEIT